MKKTVNLVLMLLIITFSLKVQAGSTFEMAWLFSDNRQYDPLHYVFPEGDPYYNGNAVWFMIAFASVAGDSDAPKYPVSLESPVYSDVGHGDAYVLEHWGSYLNYDNFSFAAFPDFPSYWRGPFAPPKNSKGVSAWEGKTYTFSVSSAIREWEIPVGSLRQLPIPRVRVQGSVHPTVLWDPVDGADYYVVIIYTLDEFDRPIAPEALHIAGPFYNQYSYTYGGEMFEHEQECVIWVQAIQNHPFSTSDPNYRDAIINRSSFFTRHSSSGGSH